MKVIDLLNKIANGEEVPNKIKWNDRTYKYVNEYKDYSYDSAYCFFEDDLLKTRILLKHLNDEVEIIDKPFNERVEEIYKRHIDYIYGEENKKIGKLYLNDEYLFSNNLSKEFTREDRRLLDSNFKELGNKINEIITYINEGDK